MFIELYCILYRKKKNEKFTFIFKNKIINQKNMIKTILITLFAFISVYINCILQIITQSYCKEKELIDLNYWISQGARNITLDTLRQKNILSDKGFNLFYNLEYLGNIPSDLIVIICVSLTILRWSFDKERKLIYHHTMILYGILYLCRGISIFLTNLPNPNLNCISTVNENNLFIEAFLVLCTYKITCYDLLFSGHTVSLTLCGMMWYQYTKKENKFIYNITCTITTLIVLLGYFLIISTHFHYSIDVFIGSLLTIFSWIALHQLKYDLS